MSDSLTIYAFFIYGFLFVEVSLFRIIPPEDKFATVMGICEAVLQFSNFKGLYLVKPDTLDLGTSLTHLHKNYSVAISTFSTVPIHREERIAECRATEYRKTHDLIMVLYPTKSVLIGLLYQSLSVPTTSFVVMSEKTQELEEVLRTAWKLRYMYKVLIVDTNKKVSYRFHPYITCQVSDWFVKLPMDDYEKQAESVAGFIKDLNKCPLTISMNVREETAYLVNNGTFTGQDGTFANLINGTSDLSLNSHFVKDYKCDTVELTRQVTSDLACVLVPKAGAVPPMFAVLKSLQLEVWAMIVIAYVAVCVAFYFWTRFSIKYMSRKVSKGCILELEVFRMLISAPTNRKFKRYSEKVLFIFCWFFSTVILNSFQGSLVTVLNTPMYFPDIDTFED
ncbi:hypothetical protein U1Q18_050855 [Sarracenia purpurea var. burkii]